MGPLRETNAKAHFGGGPPTFSRLRFWGRPLREIGEMTLVQEKVSPEMKRKGFFEAFYDEGA